jgi:RNA polymerase sigma-70 factor (ECF subfamily)
VIESERDRAADQAYRDHANDVYRVAYGILRDPDDALDATHDTFARAWERWDQYDSQRPLKGWLHGIVVHLALDQLRRRRVRRLALPVLGRATATLERTTEPDPADEVTRRQIVERALDGLRPEVRATLVLRHYYGYDYAQIGTFLGISSGTVGSTLSRAHAAIRQRLEAEDPTGAEAGADARRGRNSASGASAVARRRSSTEPPEVLP